MEFDSGRFRQVMGRFATGVTVVTTFSDGRPQGITVNALSSVSLHPPLVMVALDRSRFITPMVREHGRYAVNVLGEGQQGLSDCFAHAAVKPGREDFCGAVWHAGSTGLPLLNGAIATLECTVVEAFSAGDHDLFIGRVDALDDGGTAAEGVGPLLYFRRRYLHIKQAADAPVEGKPEA
jgi:3-hydroxy-9,10-secoandrosta-1,3,5(10)-triene-9,17-dione monooxygenase reductase component